MKIFRLLVVFSIVLSFSEIVRAQEFDFLAGGDNITITAKEGVVWDRKNQTIQVNTEATVTQKDMKLLADTITMSYQEIKGKQSITILEAVGNVIISTPTETMTGEKATYNPIQGVAVLNGKKVHLDIENGNITAELFEYFRNDNKAVARNNVVFTSKDGVVKSDIAVAHLHSEKSKNTSGISKIELFDNVKITTDNESISGTKGLYNLDKGTIIIEGNVVIKRGDSTLEGDIGEVNLISGISKLRALSNKRIDGTISPKKKQ